MDKFTWSIWCVIPIFNNAQTIRDVAARALEQPVDGVLVIDDGSTDGDITALLNNLNGVTVIRHAKNLGKGRALRTALNWLNERKIDYMVTLDGDGQHYPEDIESILPVLKDNDYTMAVGARDFSALHIPEKSRFGRKFSNFWMYLETGQKVADAQSGYRVYPVKYIAQLHFLCSYYNFETEALVKAAWAGIPIISVPVRVWYPEKSSERVSSFKPFMDNFRISLINIHLTGLRMLPLPRKKLIKQQSNPALELARHFSNPLPLLRSLLKENATPGGLAAAAAAGAFLSTLPLIGFHTVAILYVSLRLHLNKLMALNIQHFFMPPFVPLLCLEVGHYAMRGRWLTEITFDTVCRELPARILEWWIGSLILVLPLSALTALLVYGAALIIRRFCNASKQ